MPGNRKCGATTICFVPVAFAWFSASGTDGRDTWMNAGWMLRSPVSSMRVRAKR